MFSPTFLTALYATDDKYFDEFHESKRAFLDDFSSKHMMLKEMWSERYYLFEDQPGINERSIYQLHWYDPRREYDLYDEGYPKRKVYEWNLIYECFCENELAPEDFSFPQKNLQYRSYRFERDVARSFVVKPAVIQKLIKLYSEIKDAEGDDKKWYEALMASNDHEFIFHNIENRIGENLNNKSLWLIYIEYLKTHDTKKLLQTYSKFIRFFVEDLKMLNEYREAVKQYGPVLVPWKNAKDFEIYDEKFFEKEKECQGYKRTLPITEKPLHRFNPETATTQEFPFHLNCTKYIRENASTEILHKLYKSCKSFPKWFPKNICYKMNVVTKTNGPFDAGYTDSFAIEIQYLQVASQWLQNLSLQNLFIANVFNFFFGCKDPMALSKFIPKIFRCTAKFIQICQQQLTFDELKILIDNGNVIELYLYEVSNSDKNSFKIEDILQLTPCIKDIHLHDVQCTVGNSKKLCELEFKNKIEHICFSLDNDLLDPNDFAKFLTKNFSSDARVSIEFYFIGKEAYVKRLKDIAESALKALDKENSEFRYILNIS